MRDRWMITGDSDMYGELNKNQKIHEIRVLNFARKKKKKKKDDALERSMGRWSKIRRRWRWRCRWDGG